MDCTQFIIKVIYDSNSIKLSWYAYCIRTSVPEQNCTIEIAYCQTIWHDKLQCDICNDNKCTNTFQEKYKTRETPGPRTVMTHSAKWHCVRELITFIIHCICTKLKIFAQICFGLQISILILTSLVSAIVEGVLRTMCSTKIHHRVHKRPPFVPTLRQMNPGQRLPHFFDTPTLLDWGTAVAQWLRCCATNWKVTGSILAGVTGIFHWHKILPIALWPWRRLSLQQKWAPGVFPGGKGGRYIRLTTLPQSWAVVMKSGNLNFLEPSGPLQACNGTDLLLHRHYYPPIYE